MSKLTHLNHLDNIKPEHRLRNGGYSNKGVKLKGLGDYRKENTYHLINSILSVTQVAAPCHEREPHPLCIQIQHYDCPAAPIRFWSQHWRWARPSKQQAADGHLRANQGFVHVGH